MTNEYHKQAEDFLTKHGFTFKAVLIGSDCPLFCADAEKQRNMGKVNTYPRKTHIHGYDTDSRKAETIYHAVTAEFQGTRRYFTAEELEELQQIN